MRPVLRNGSWFRLRRKQIVTPALGASRVRWRQPAVIASELSERIEGGSPPKTAW